MWSAVDPSMLMADKKIITKHAPVIDEEMEADYAFTRLNDIRAEMGMTRFVNSDILKIGALAHAKYLVANDESDHYEKLGLEYYVANAPVDRAMKYGYTSKFVSENLSTKNSGGEDSIKGLFSAIYHRFGFLNPSMNEIGVGIVQDKAKTANTAFVYLMGNSDIRELCNGKSFTSSGKYWKPCKDGAFRVESNKMDRAQKYSKISNPKIIKYPYAGQENVAPVFYDESPDPLPDYEVSGFPISIEFNDYYFDTINISSFKLYNDKGHDVSCISMDKASDPNSIFSENQFALFPLERLDYNKKYTVKISYSSKDKKYSDSWSFATKSFQEKIIEIQQNYVELELERNKGYILYFKPLTASDYITNMQFPNNVKVDFIDHNTVRFFAPNESTDAFDMDFGNKKLHIKLTD